MAMAIGRGIDGADPAGPPRAGEAADLVERRRTTRSLRIASGTLACPACDAPVALAGRRLRPADDLACPFCGHGGAVREFLSLARPPRPERVAVVIVTPSRRAASRAARAGARPGSGSGRSQRA